MANPILHLRKKLEDKFSSQILNFIEHAQQLTIVISKDSLLPICQQLLNDSDLLFEQLIDVTAVDYLHYGYTEWQTQETTFKGYSRGVEKQPVKSELEQPRFAVVYHLLSMTHNQRLRLKVFIDESELIVPSVNALWNSANWFEREVFDLFGIIFDEHPDLRRILTDYGFIGHPFRKDFPLIGNVEVRYDAEQKRVIYEPVSIEPRTLVPRVIREDHRYHNVMNKA